MNPAFTESEIEMIKTALNQFVIFWRCEMREAEIVRRKDETRYFVAKRQLAVWEALLSKAEDIA